MLARLGLALVLLAACSRPTAPQGSREVTDGLGRRLRLPQQIRRIVSIAPSSTEILFAIGAGPKVVGLDRFSNWPPEAAPLPRVGADVDPSLERIVGLRPDVVFSATSANTQATADGLGRLGIPVYVSRSLSFEEILGDVAGIGQAAGHPAEAHALIDRMRSESSLPRPDPPVRTLIVVWPDPLIVAGRGSHIGDLVRLAGGANVAVDSAQAFPAYSLERVIAHAPEVIVVGAHQADAPPPLDALLRLSSVPAIRDRRLHVLDGDLLFRPGPRAVEGLRALSALLRPAPSLTADGFAPRSDIR